jgi:hypothetical protein
MSNEEKLARAEKFIRETVADMGSTVRDDELREAAELAAKALPPFDQIAA